MKRFTAAYSDKNNTNQLRTESGQFYAEEARFDIIAESEARALELIAQQGENPEEFELSEVSSAAKDEMGRFFPESIRDARI